MDFSNAIIKISDIVNKIQEFVNKIKDIYNKYAKKINGYIDEYTKAIDRLMELGETGIDWVSMKISKLTKKMQDAIDSVLERVNILISQIKVWYDKTITKIKIDTIKAVFAKIGQSIDDTGAELFADMIPHPGIDSLLPTISINMEIPDFKKLVNTDFESAGTKLKQLLKKLPLL